MPFRNSNYSTGSQDSDRPVSSADCSHQRQIPQNGCWFPTTFSVYTVQRSHTKYTVQVRTESGIQVAMYIQKSPAIAILSASNWQKFIPNNVLTLCKQ